MDSERVTEVLESIGMSKSEIKIYIDLIQNQRSSALDISKRTKIHRSNTYDTLRNLISKGFAKEFLENKRKLFLATEPEKIKNYLKNKEREIETIIGQLTSFSNTHNSEEKISFTQGVFAVRQALLDLLEKNSTINTYGASNATVNFFGRGFLEDFHRRRIKRKIQMRQIYNPDSIQRINYLNKLRFTEARALPKKYDTNISTLICDGILNFIIFSKPLSVISIHNKEITDAYNKYFELLWGRAVVPSEPEQKKL